MDIKQFLLHDKTINRSELARRMWPGNKNPQAYLSNKLIGAKPFTRRDAERALEVIQQMVSEMSAVNIEEVYTNPKPGPRSKQE
jgi:hypothetical protein